MKLNNYINLTEAIKAFQERGFNRSFGFENGSLKCYQTGKVYQADELQIVEYHRFKNDNRHPHDCVIFAIESMDGEKGYTSSSEKNVSNFRLLEFMDNVKIQPRNLTVKSLKRKAQY